MDAAARGSQRAIRRPCGREPAMARAAFMALCCDGGDKATCECTKALMRNSGVCDSRPGATQGDPGERKFAAADAAVGRVGGLLRLADHDVLDTGVRWKF